MPRGGHDIPVSGTHLKGTQWLRRVDPTVVHLKGTLWSRRVWTPHINKNKIRKWKRKRKIFSNDFTISNFQTSNHLKLI